MLIKKSFFMGCLLLMSVIFVGAAEEAGLSVTVTESYQIRNLKFGDLLRPKDANSAEGTAIVLYPAQPWKCMTWQLQPAGETGFHVQNHFTRKTFQMKAGDAEPSVVQTTLSREVGNRPSWRFTKLPDGSYQISDAKSGKVLTAVVAKGRSVIIAEKWEDKSEQKWKLEKIDPASLTM